MRFCVKAPTLPHPPEGGARLSLTLPGAPARTASLAPPTGDCAARARPARCASPRRAPCRTATGRWRRRKERVRRPAVGASGGEGPLRSTPQRRGEPQLLVGRLLVQHERAALAAELHREHPLLRACGVRLSATALGPLPTARRTVSATSAPSKARRSTCSWPGASARVGLVALPLPRLDGLIQSLQRRVSRRVELCFHSVGADRAGGRRRSVQPSSPGAGLVGGAEQGGCAVHASRLRDLGVTLVAYSL